MKDNNYAAAISDFVEFCAAYAQQIAAIYLGGSVARGDHTTGRSDVDIFVVLYTRDAAIEQALTAYARELDTHYFANMLYVHPQPFSVTYTSLEEIDAGSSFLGAGFEYHAFVASTKRLRGEDVIARIPQTDDARSHDIAYFGLNILHALAEAQDPNHVNPDLAGFLFSPIFRAAAIALGGLHVFVGGKQETVEAFAAVYPNELQLVEQLRHAYVLWQTWAIRDLSMTETQELGVISKRFVGGIYGLWVER